MHIETIRLKNFKAFRNVTITDIPRFCVFVGANGSGKSTLFDVFGFLRDALKNNIREALQIRGGFKEVVSRDREEETIKIQIKFRMHLTGKDRLVTYHLEIGQKRGKVQVNREILRYKRGTLRLSISFFGFFQW